MHESPKELLVMPMRHPLLHGRLQIRSQLLKLDGGRCRKKNGHLELISATKFTELFQKAKSFYVMTNINLIC
jgi:hypothetical protein